MPRRLLFVSLLLLVAAYLVGGFMVASVYAVGMLKGRRDRYHRLGFLIPFTVAAIATGTDERWMEPRSAGRRAAGASCSACSVMAFDIRPGTPRTSRQSS